MNICLKKADPAKKEILFRLLQYSLFEESLHDQNTINEDALFDYPWFDLYFTEKDRAAFFIHEQDTSRLSAGITSAEIPPSSVLRCIRETGKSLHLSEAGRHICSGKM